MSTDYAAVCATCNETIHLGVRMAGNILCFGNGRDDVLGRDAVAWWIEEHCAGGHGVLVMDSAAVPDGVPRLGSDELEAAFAAARPDQVGPRKGQIGRP